jgi:methyltransferase (TIGR00027 family)
VVRDAEPSRTSIISAFNRARHRNEHDRPWVLDDPYGPLLFGPGWQQLDAATRGLADQDIGDRLAAFVCARSRYVEDRLEAGAFEQYVILGAGLDSIAWRRPDLLRSVTLFEVDHPATQRWKREQVERLALPVVEQHRFVEVDFGRQDLAAELHTVGFDWAAPTLWSWLGVTAYLDTSEIEATLRVVARCVDGSELVLTYGIPHEENDDSGKRMSELLDDFATRSGEPLKTRMTAEETDALLTDNGFAVVENLTHAELCTRYFADRADGLRPHTIERIATARIV